ncbi:MAG: tetratricopeptide repeat protein [Planctomycetota bacterium]
MTVDDSQSRSIRAWMLGLVAAILATAGGILIYATHYSPDISYLPTDRRAEWILYPHHRSPVAHTRFPMKTEFRKTFTVGKQLPSAMLHFRAMREAKILVNGKPLEVIAAGNWKRIQNREITPLLHAGENEISATVTNGDGPPALWLYVDAPDWTLASDASWQTSLVGATWLPARTANEVITQADLFFHPAAKPGSAAASLRRESEKIRPGFETTIQAVKSRAFLLLVFLVMGTCLWLGGEYLTRRDIYSRRAARNAPKPRKGSAGLEKAIATNAEVAKEEMNCPDIGNRGWLILFSITALGWVVLTAHNATVLPGPLGFDYPGHIEYLDYLLKENWLPLPTDGWQMYQPPVYYLLTAIPLKIFRLEPSRPPGLHWIRAVQIFIAVTQLAIVLFSLRLLFPGNSRRQWGGFLIAAFFPALVYLSQYVTNELLTSTLASAAVLNALWIFRRPDPPTRAYVLLGIWLGLGLLAKVTALIVAIVTLTILAGRLVVDRNGSPKAWAGTLGVTLLSMLLVCGWHYGRIKYHYGDWVVGNWDPRTGFSWWQDPGFRASSYYLRFGKSLVQPIYIGMDSFWDTIYITLWGDGMCASGAEPRYRTPWNYDLMTAGFLLALVPTTLILVGTVAATWEFIQRPTSSGFLIVGLLFSCGMSLVFATLRLPFYGQAKAFYVLAALLPLCLAGGWGFDMLARQSRWLQRILGSLLVAWNLNNFAIYWVDGNSPVTLESTSHHLALIGRNPDAVEQLSKALRLDPNYPPSILDAATNLTPEPSRLNESLLLFRRALSLDPQSADALAGMGIVHKKRGDLPQAKLDFEKALAINPNLQTVWMDLADVYAAIGENDKAETAYREVLRLWPSSGTAHQRLAVIHDRLNNVSQALQQGEYATQLLRGEPIPASEQADRLTKVGRYSEAIDLLRKSLALHPEAVLLKIYLAWNLATSPFDSDRDGKEAVRLAEEARQALPTGETGPLDALAAAYAEVGRYDEAAAVADRLAAALNNSEQRREIEKRAALYRQKKPYRDSPTPAKP